MIIRNVQREPYFDIVKGVAMILVVMQHCFLYFDGGQWQGCMLNKMSALVSVPLFMFVSGYFNVNLHMGGGKKLFKRFVALIIPFVSWAYIYFFYENSCEPSFTSVIEFSTNLVVAPYFGTTMWFLRTLFLQILLVYICNRLFREHSDIAICISYIFLLLIAVVITDKFAIKSIIGNMPWFMMGYWCHKYSLIQQRFFRFLSVISILIFFIIMFGKEHIDNLIIKSMLFKGASLFGIMGLLGVILIGKKILFSSLSMLNYLGHFTLEIYTTHFLVIWFLRDFGFSINSGSMYLSYFAYLSVSIILTIAAFKVLRAIPVLSWVLYYKKPYELFQRNGNDRENISR